MIIQRVNEHQFIDAFKTWDTYKNNFSYEGLKSLYDYLENYEEETGQKVKFDPVALCCEYSEYDNLQSVIENYNSTHIQTIDDLNYNTSVIEIKGTDRIIIRDF